MTIQTTKFFKTRDSATAALRKLGIAVKDYSLYIDKTEDGLFACQIAKAQIALTSKKPAGKKATRKKKIAEVPTTARASDPHAKKSQKPPSLAKTVKQLMLSGWTNEEIWAEVQPKFSVPDTKKWYISWWRSDFRRRGILPTITTGA